MNAFPNDLLLRFKGATTQLKKVQRATFKRFAPNVAEVSNEFHQLAVAFQNASLPQFAALCWLGASKCEETTHNYKAQIDYAFKSSRAFIEAYKEDKVKALKADENAYCLEGALRGFNQIQSILDDDSPLKAAAIREMKKYHPNCDLKSSFASPSHRYYDLELSASECINVEDYVVTLEKYTEIVDDIDERKVGHLYSDLISRTEFSRILLLLLLDLPPSRQSPSHLMLLDKMSQNYTTDNLMNFEPEVFYLLADIIIVWKNKDTNEVKSIIDKILALKSITKEQRVLLRQLSRKYSY